ncbi:unnamed protein product [Camellia sinensis]
MAGVCLVVSNLAWLDDVIQIMVMATTMTKKSSWNGNLPVSFIQMYLVKKLDLTREAEFRHLLGLNINRSQRIMYKVLLRE